MRPQGLGMLPFLAGALPLEVIIFHLGHHILGQGQIAAHHIAGKALGLKSAVGAIQGAGKIGSAALVPWS